MKVIPRILFCSIRTINGLAPRARMASSILRINWFRPNNPSAYYDHNLEVVKRHCLFLFLHTFSVCLYSERLNKKKRIFFDYSSKPTHFLSLSLTRSSAKTVSLWVTHTLTVTQKSMSTSLSSLNRLLTLTDHYYECQVFQWFMN